MFGASLKPGRMRNLKVNIFYEGVRFADAERAAASLRNLNADVNLIEVDKDPKNNKV